MDPEKQRDLEKILKCLALSAEEGNGTHGERDTARKMAEKIMAKWGLEYADIYRHGKAEERQAIFVKVEVELRGNRKDKLEHFLAASVARAFDGDAIGSVRWSDGKPIVYICATKLEAEIIIFIFKSLRRTVSKMADMYAKSNPYSTRGDKDAYRLGLIKTLAQRLSDMYKRRNAAMDEECRALILVKKDDIQKFVASAFTDGRVKTKPLSVSGSREAFRAGLADGHKVNIASPGESKARERITASS